MTLRSIEGDEHYGIIGFGSMTLSGNDAFSTGTLPAIAEPDLIIANRTGRRTLEIDVKDVLVWDNQEWLPQTDSGADITGGENIPQEAKGGITKDNTVEANAIPTSDSVAQGTTPGGNGAAQVGATATSPTLIGQTAPRFVSRWEFWQNDNEEQSAVGHILHVTRGIPEQIIPKYKGYVVNGHTVFYLMTAAHYHQWYDTNNLVAAGTQSVGGFVRRMSLDIQEVMFDREVLLSILDALVVSS